MRNITDIDDKIIERAAANGENWADLARRFTAAMHEDCATLGLQKPDLEPRATEFIAPIIAMIQTLIDKGFAYAADNGDVMYSVRKFPGYGRLSGQEDRRLARRLARPGGRRQARSARFRDVEARQTGRAVLGLALGTRAGPAGTSNARRCRPACSGDYFDLHGGGEDLKFPHHENEIAQSCAACDSPFVHVWMHNGFVRVNEEKMSKSLGNFFTVREVLEDPARS